MREIAALPISPDTEFIRNEARVCRLRPHTTLVAVTSETAIAANQRRC